MKIKVTFETDVPDDISDADLMEWLRFELFANGSIKTSNPIHDVPLEASFQSVHYEQIN